MTFHRALRRLLLPALPFMTASCAEIAPPPGGPVDVIAPAIIAAIPDSLAAGVDPALPFQVTFSERIVKDRFNDWIFIRPFRRIDRINWNDNTASLIVRGGWPVDSTITITIGTGIADRSGNRLPRPFRRTFSTGASVHPGVLAGEVRRTRAPAVTTTTDGESATGRAGVPSPPLPGSATRTGPTAAVFLWVYRATADTLPDLVRDDPDYLTEASPDGRFRLEGLPPGVPLRLFAIYDSDLSRTFTPDRDFATLYPDTLLLTTTDPVREALSILLIDPKSPGTVTGRLAPDTLQIPTPTDSAGVDTVSYGVLLSQAPAAGDTAVAWPPSRAVRQGPVGKDGAFSIRTVPPGRYQAAAFLDRDRNGQWSRLEELGPPVEIAVEPDGETGGVVLERPVRGTSGGP